MLKMILRYLHILTPLVDKIQIYDVLCCIDSAFISNISLSLEKPSAKSIDLSM